MKERVNLRRLIELVAVFVVTLLIMIGASNLLKTYGEGISSNLTMVMTETLIVIPAVIYCLIRKINIKDDLGFRGIRVSTFFLSILLGILAMPISSFVNVLTQFFVPNTMVQASGELMEGSKLLMLCIVGIYAPICEEFTFRGLLNREISKYSTPVIGMVLSAVFFGITHMNLNQMCYAVILGMIFAIVNNSARSIYPSVIMHIVINSINILMLMAVSIAYDMVGGNLAQSTEELRTNTTGLGLIAAVYFVFALVAGILMIPCIKAIKKAEKS